MPARHHTYRITVEHIVSARESEPVHPTPLVFDAQNHDDLFRIVERARTATGLPPDEAAAMAVGLKLLSEIALTHRRNDLFSDLANDLGTFIGRLKAQRQTA